MLLIISDLHLTDGTNRQTLSPSAMDMFANRLRDMAESASYRTGGEYRPIEKIELVLLGDIIDVTRSLRWLGPRGIRPWGDTRSREFIDTLNEITTQVVQHNKDSLRILRAIATEGAVRIPLADAAGRPVWETEGQAVPVNIHYMVGNSDWFYRLPGTAYDLIRQKLVHHFGLCHPPNIPFPHDPYESESLLEIMRKHRVFARHGDVYDPLAFEEDRNTSSLTDVIDVELVARFTAHIENYLSVDLPAATLVALRQIDDVRPIVQIPLWIDCILERTCPTPALRKEVKQVWDNLTDQMLALPYVRNRQAWRSGELVDWLAGSLKFHRGAGLEHPVSASAANALLAESEYHRHAIAEPDFRNRRAKHIVYGHTHRAENVPLEASFAEGFVLSQMYFNTGTWRRTFRPTIHAPHGHEFIAQDSMTYLSFYQEDERKGRPYESWTGALAVDPTELVVYRVDRGDPVHAGTESVSSSAVSHRGPHFATSPARSPIVPKRRVS